MIVQNVRSCIVHMTLHNFFIQRKECACGKRTQHQLSTLRIHSGFIYYDGMEEPEIFVYDSDTDIRALCNAGQTFSRERDRLL